jgi:uncharacterized membrane protein (DUF4010 family)
MPTVDPQIWLHLGLALALGLLVGLEREQSGHATGIRTFPLLTIFGACTTLLVEPVGQWIVPAGLVVLGGALFVYEGSRASLLKAGVDSGEEPFPELGMTTIVAALVMYLIGAMLVAGYTPIAVAVGGMTAVLLRWKRPLHDFADRLGPTGYRAVYRFVLLAVVVLPVLPDRTYGPYDVFNPFQIWLVVVLIVGISVFGYILYKFVGPRAGVLVGGTLGGIVSSTAATVAYARRAARDPSVTAGAAVAIMIASTLSFLRIVVEVLVVAWEIRWVIVPKFAVLIAVMTLVSVIAYRGADDFQANEEHEPEDPASLKVAVVFGAMYAVILFFVAITERHFGDTGMYVLAVISGLTDVDAITLSTAEMIQADRVSKGVGWRMMLIGGISNMAFKGGVAAVLGGRRLLKRIAVMFGVTLLAGFGILLLWPGA